MTQIVSAVGIDCGKAWLDAAVFPQAQRLRVANTPAGHRDLMTWIAPYGPGAVGLEASGGYERGVRDALRQAGWTVHVLDPARVRHFAKATGQRAKTDALDAAVIAAFTARLGTTAPRPPDPAREELAGLVRARRLLVDKRADLNKAVAPAPGVAKAALEQAVSALSTAIASLDETIERQIEAIPALAQTIRRLRTVPGIGSVCAIALAALMPELGHTPGASIAALIGVAPYPDDSGKHCGPRHIAGGRADARRFLYMAAMVAATRTRGVLATTYQHLLAKGKPHKVALTACMRKLIVRINAMLMAGTVWEDKTA